MSMSFPPPTPPKRTAIESVIVCVAVADVAGAALGV